MFFCQRASQSVLVPGSANDFAFPPGAPEARRSRMLLAAEATAMVWTETPLKNSRRFIDGLRLYFEGAHRQHLSPRGRLGEASLPKSRVGGDIPPGCPPGVQPGLPSHDQRRPESNAILVRSHALVPPLNGAGTPRRGVPTKIPRWWGHPAGMSARRSAGPSLTIDFKLVHPNHRPHPHALKILSRKGLPH